MEINAAVTRLSALSQTTRLEIFRLLVRYGREGRRVGDIQSELGLAAATLSFHLKELSRAGLLHARQDGRCIYYAPDFAAMNELLGYLTENCCTASADTDHCRPVAACQEC